MREPACQRFDQFHPEMPVVCTVRQLQGPSRPTTLPGFLFLSSFGASQSFPAVFLFNSPSDLQVHPR